MTEDLGLKIGTKDQAYLEHLKENHEKALIMAKADTKLNEFAIKYFEDLIAVEKEKLK